MVSFYPRRRLVGVIEEITIFCLSRSRCCDVTGALGRRMLKRRIFTLSARFRAVRRPEGRVFGRTLKILPSWGNHLAPDAMHLMMQLLLVAVIVCGVVGLVRREQVNKKRATTSVCVGRQATIAKTRRATPANLIALRTVREISASSGSTRSCEGSPAKRCTRF